ncbi:unnamed protein product [Chironomus riparius]|uniref:Ionotropic receptor n=1 Tax=Chironomus riparius TaxID=315576 RepID=A0A9N9S069_9DIPT|nr:unnamed protein product [Chironomus riparius]
MSFGIILILFNSCNLIYGSQLVTQSILNISDANPTHSKIKNLNLTILIRQIPNIKQNLQQSAIIFANHVNQADELRSNLMLDNCYAKHLIFIIVFVTGHIKYLKFSRLGFLTHRSKSIDLYSYFIASAGDSNVLINLKWFSEYYCNKPQLTITNVFSKHDQKWLVDLKYQRNYMNFWNCMITLLTDFEDIFGVNLYYGTITGLVPEFVRIMSIRGNFTLNYQIHYYNDVYDTNTGKIIYPNIYMRLGLSSKFTNGKVHFGSAFLPSDYPFYVTPGELFTSYEKLFLPFDDTTWLFIFITFSVAFAVIFVVYFLPKWTQTIFYGSTVRNSSLNIVQIFFGISQLQVPVENAPRIILIFFVFFCLVIRTAYQGISFDFLTTEMRKKPIDSIEKLVSQNFTIVTMEGSGFAFVDYIFSMIGEEQKNNIMWISDFEIENFYKNNIKNSSARLAFFMQDTFFDRIHFSTNGIQGINLKQKLFSYPIGFITYKNYFMNELIEDTLQLMIPAGIPQYLYEYHRWLKFGRVHVDRKV